MRDGRAWYNEHDPKAAAWLRELIARGLIAPGVVDERSIVDVQPRDLDGFTQCHFFAGIGGWSLALRLAMWPDDRPVWTGSCPCQPFSAAGKRKGFDDDRHLWPEFRRLVQERRPAVVFGEQVAAASAWLGLVRGDLEAMEYAVGAMPIEAASAGADHLRDRFWFVGDHQGVGRREGRPEHELWCGRHASSGDGRSGVAQGDAYDTRPQGRPAEFECADQRPAWSAGLANTYEPCPSQEREQRSGQQRGVGGDPGSCNGDLAHGDGDGAGNGTGEGDCPKGAALGFDGHLSRPGAASGFNGTARDWVVGADGKARRIKPGIRLLVDGFPHRVGLLRGFGNAIDPRPAAAFIAAADEAMRAV